MQSAANHNNTHDASDSAALAWYCIETLIDAIRELSNNTLADSGKTGNKGKDAHTMIPPATESHLHRLHLTLVATVPSLPLPLMLPVLDRIRDIVLEKDLSSLPHVEHHVRSDIGASSKGRGNIPPERKAELVDALFREILERVGDMEKEAAMRWWYVNLEELRGAIQGGDGARYSADRIVDREVV